MTADLQQTGSVELGRWIAVSDLVTESLFPDFYGQEFLELDKIFQTQKEQYIALGELVRLVGQPFREVSEYAWLAIPQEGKIELRDDAPARIDSGFALPPEAILVARASQALPAVLWREDVWGGKGAAGLPVVVLEPVTAESIAWLAKELGQPYCQKQMQRFVRGHVIPAIQTTDLLRVRVRKLPLESRRAASEIALQELRVARNQDRLDRLKGLDAMTASPGLSGATFEERRQQFEQCLRQQTDAVPIAFVEASTTNIHSDLFAMRPLSPGPSGESVQTRFAGPPDPASELEWRRWYWDGKENACRIYHSGSEIDGYSLPPDLFGRLAATLLDIHERFVPGATLLRRWKRGPGGQMLLPEPGQIRALVQAGEQLDGDLTRDWQDGVGRFVDLTGVDGEILSHALHDVYVLLKRLYRPILAVRVARSGRATGVYFVGWASHQSDPAVQTARLREFGGWLLSLLAPPDDLTESAARRESMRRLSWFNHQVNGPVGRADAALQDIIACLEKNEQVAALLVPDEASAARMAAMAAQPVEQYQLRHRLGAALQAVADLRRMSDQIRKFTKVQRDFARTPCKLSTILEQQIQLARQSLPQLRITDTGLPDLEIQGNAQILEEVFQEIFNNSIRELTARKIDAPSIEVAIARLQDRVVVSVRDNGLPPLVNLIDEPFAEESSTYARRGQGSGLGLAIARETILRHLGTCTLTANCAPDGERIWGVTFSCDFPLLETASVSPDP